VFIVMLNIIYVFIGNVCEFNMVFNPTDNFFIVLLIIQSILQGLQLYHLVEMVDCWLWHQDTHLRREINCNF